MHHQTLFHVAVVVLPLCIATAGYADTAGKVVYAYGAAQVLDATGQARAVRRGEEVATGQTLITQNGRMQVRFADGGFIAVQPNTQFKIDEYRYVGVEDGSERSFFNLVKGGIRFVTGTIGHKNKQNYKIKTPVATIGIRGSAGRVEMCVGGSCAGRSDGAYATGHQDILTMMNETDVVEFRVGETVYTQCLTCPIRKVGRGPEAFAAVTREGEEEPLFVAGEQRDESGDLVVLGNLPTGTVGTMPTGTVGTMPKHVSFRTVTQSSQSFLFDAVDDVPIGFAPFDTTGRQRLPMTGSTKVDLSASQDALVAYEFHIDQVGSSTFNSGSASLVETGRSAAAGDVFWGRWDGGYNATSSSQGGSGQPFGNDPGGYHFMYGTAFGGDLGMLQSTIGTATYVAQGGTTPTDQSGAEGVFQGGQITVNFGNATFDGNFDVLMPLGELFAATFAGSVIPGFPGNGVQIDSSLGGICTGGSCRATVPIPIEGHLNGGFTGAAAQGLITNYDMFAGSEHVIGTQAYAR